LRPLKIGGPTLKPTLPLCYEGIAKFMTDYLKVCDKKGQKKKVKDKHAR